MKWFRNMPMIVGNLAMKFEIKMSEIEAKWAEDLKAYGQDFPYEVRS